MGISNAAAKASACEEKLRLEQTYRIAHGDYERAVSLLHERRGAMYRMEYDSLSRFADEALY